MDLTWLDAIEQTARYADQNEQVVSPAMALRLCAIARAAEVCLPAFNHSLQNKDSLKTINLAACDVRRLVEAFAAAQQKGG